MAIKEVELTRTLVYQNQATIQAVQADIDQLRGVDRRNEKLQTLWFWVAVAGGVMAGLGLIVGFVTEFGQPPVFRSLMASGVVALVVGLVLRRKHGRLNFEDKRYELLRHVLRLLEKDTAASAEVRVRLDLGRPDTRQKFVNHGKVRYWNVRFYEDPWLQLDGRLMDGTTYSLAVVERCQQRSRVKTSISGKRKVKKKAKSATQAVLRLRAKPTKYKHLDRLAVGASKAVQLPPWASLKSLQIDNNTLVLKTGVKSDWSVPDGGRARSGCDGVQLIAMMFLSLYQVLNLSRAMGKTAPGAT